MSEKEKTVSIEVTKNELWAIHFGFTTLGDIIHNNADAVRIEGDSGALTLWGESVVSLGKKMGVALKEIK